VVVLASLSLRRRRWERSRISQLADREDILLLNVLTGSNAAWKCLSLSSGREIGNDKQAS
jgi:hypothetical protein